MSDERLLSAFQIKLESQDRQLRAALESVRSLRLAVSFCERAALSGDAGKLAEAAKVCRDIVDAVPNLDVLQLHPPKQTQ